MSNKILLISLTVIVLITIGILAGTSNLPTDQKKFHITTSFYPLGEIARQIVNDKADVTVIVPTGVEPHDYEPSPQDRITIQNTDVLIYNGAGFEPWINRIMPELDAVSVIDVSKTISLLPATESEEHTTEETEQLSTFDPHFWLDPQLMQELTQKIASKLIELDPDNNDYYSSNAQNYINELVLLDSQFQTLQSCRKKSFVTSHAAFAYLSKRYGLTQIPIAGLSEEEPSPARLAEIIKLIKQYDIKYIFFETLVSPRLAETIASEVKAETLILNPIEGLTSEETKNEENYISLMQKNLANLKVALECDD